jgi:hypothetical protein
VGLHGGIYDSWKEILLSDLRALYERSLSHIASRFEPLWGLGKAEKEISLNQSVDVSNFAQTPDGQRRKSNNNRYASQAFGLNQ